MLSSVLKPKNFCFLTTLHKNGRKSALSITSSKKTIFLSKILSSENEIPHYVKDSQLYNVSQREKNLGTVVRLDENEVQPYLKKSKKIEVKTVSREKKQIKLFLDKEKSPQNEFDEIIGNRTPKVRPSKNWYTEEELGYSYRLSTVVSTLKLRKYREEQKKILVEGKRLIQDAVKAGLQPLVVYFSHFEDVENLGLGKNVKLCKVLYKSFKLWSDVVTPQGILAVFNIPSLENPIGSDTIPLKVVCDNIRDPGNMGSIIRVAAAVGCEKLILTKGCVDVWEQKVLRSAAGGHFRIPLIQNMEWDNITSELSEEDEIVLAEADGSKPAFEEKNMNPSTVAHKLRESIIQECYHSKEYSAGDGVVLVIGGETSGLSDEAYNLAKERNGCKVHIPLCNSTESLNSGVASGILMYEIRRQWNISANSYN